VFNDITKKYKNVNDYKFVPVGFSAGGFMALFFSQKYYSQCSNVILLDPALYTQKNMKLRLKYQFPKHMNRCLKTQNSQITFPKP